MVKAYAPMSPGEFRNERRVNPHPLCPKCKTFPMRRLPREGFWQEKVFPQLGLYPWECPTCRKLRLMPHRGQTRRYKWASLHENPKP